MVLAIEIEMIVIGLPALEAGHGPRDAVAESWDPRARSILIDTYREHRAEVTVVPASQDEARFGDALEAETVTVIEIGPVIVDGLGIGMMIDLDAGAAAGAAGETGVGIRIGREHEAGAAVHTLGEKELHEERGAEVETEIGTVTETETETEIETERGGTEVEAEAKAEKERGAAAQGARGPNGIRTSDYNVSCMNYRLVLDGVWDDEALWVI
jgi:hypothetical protein